MHIPTRLGVKTFSQIDQDLFAKMSGDANPMHVDAIAARRTQAGAPVVHGVHALLWSLDLLIKLQSDRKISDIAMRFERFIYVEEQVEAVLIEAASGTSIIELRTDGTRAAVATLGSATERSLESPLITAAAHRISIPLLRDVEDLRGLTGAFFLANDHGKLEHAFPDLTRALGAETVRSIAGLSTLVGMECPGLLSIFSKLRVELGRVDMEGQPTLRYSVRRLQALLRSTVIDVQAPGLTGSVEAFVRQPPITQPSMENLRTTISGNLTKNDHVLIVGGSRGIGELTAKLVSLGGARVTITYARGENEAQSVAREIKSTGGKCDVMRLDVSESIAEQMSLPSSPFTHCYYFATPPIFRKRGLAFDRTTLDSFITFYIEAFHELSELLLSRNPQARIFTPSTSAIDERPAGSLEYVTSKLGTERLAEDMSRRHPKARIITSRFPRILTDQTATVLPVRSEDPLSILVPLIHSLHEK